MADGEKTGAATRLIKSVAPLTSTLAKVLRGAPTMVTIDYTGFLRSRRR
ncbi:hypothetical protein ABIE78_000444 [Sinorhizobium fredii]|uniref:Uncharacterized protein n=1 Tax=Sinorhizobium fredii (strain USDA 257) TaxID=1185652 RepID=I3XH88_SINF2|nr:MULTISPECIES: hypothetical protein [Sinorhizobium]MCK3781261.1 hypothetical protein [Ensifer sesbaniae]AFL55244.1 hypothetical protein USDA257_p05290 [Sinorhizobium fredii USDA 257]ASY60700.1 hypothetical protein SS05631_a43160 [Sinorhizobium sp. CCBAU 05631]ASY74129.1 hypothetical protein SF83666_a45420 [Sinorhizobium fredii CCBAU 83666]AWI61885.1 hypothetical protein AB395_00004360 [Sinorhizobium fredii CCBAU 45436]